MGEGEKLVEELRVIRARRVEVRTPGASPRRYYFWHGQFEQTLGSACYAEATVFASAERQSRISSRHNHVVDDYVSRVDA